MPFGCAYSIFRYRLLDIAFVVNRATVFGVTSLLVLGALALVDLGLQNLLGSWLRSTGIYVQLGLALIIGISTRPLHHRVDALVDDLFFRRRHDAERTLRHFARDAAYIDDSAIVIARTVETVAHAAQIHCSMFLLTSGSFRCAATSANGGESAPVERNDGAVVGLLATRSPVDLHDVQTDISGDFAMPRTRRMNLMLSARLPLLPDSRSICCASRRSSEKSTYFVGASVRRPVSTRLSKPRNYRQSFSTHRSRCARDFERY